MITGTAFICFYYYFYVAARLTWNELACCCRVQEAVALARVGDHVGAAACYSLLFEEARHQHTTHGELYVCYTNRAAAYLELRVSHGRLWAVQE